MTNCEFEILFCYSHTLAKGCYRILRPRTPHAIVMIDDSLMLTRHFYSYATLSLTTLSTIMDHLYDGITVPFVFPTAMMLLFKMAAGIHEDMQRGADSFGIVNSFISLLLLYNMLSMFSTEIPNVYQTAWLIFFVFHANSLHPSDTGDVTYVAWHGTQDFEANWRISRMVAKALLEINAIEAMRRELAGIFNYLHIFVENIVEHNSKAHQLKWMDLHTSNVFAHIGEMDIDDGQLVDI